jgi:hypothetical protein
MRRRFFVAVVVVAGCLMSVGPRCWSEERREVEEDGDPGSLVLYRMARSCTVVVPEYLVHSIKERPNPARDLTDGTSCGSSRDEMQAVHLVGYSLLLGFLESGEGREPDGCLRQGRKRSSRIESQRPKVL